MQKLRVCSIAIKRGTMRVRAEVVNLRARGDSFVERRATKNGRYRKWLGETVEPRPNGKASLRRR